jgi:hypothetical protein
MATSSSGHTEAMRTNAARVRVRNVVRRLVAAQGRQVFATWLGQAVLLMLVVAAGSLLLFRLGWLDVSTAKLLPAFAGVGLLVWLWMLWRGRPDSLQVVIAADERLKLKQRLSSAWEMELRGEDALADLLARQAVHRRLGHRAGVVFPATLSPAGRFIPAGVALLILAVTLNVRPISDDQAIADGARFEADEVVANAGARLLEYAQRMEARALHQALPRAREQALTLGRLGSAMGHEDIVRGRAIERLASLGASMNASREEVFEQAATLDLDAVRNDKGQLRTALRSLGIGEMLRRMAAGTMSDRDLSRLEALGEEMSRLGVSRQTLARAIERFRAGDSQELEKLLSKMGQAQRLLSDADELSRAGERVRRARVRLGDRRAATPGGEALSDGSVPGSGDDNAAPDDGELTDQLVGDAPAASGISKAAEGEVRKARVPAFDRPAAKASATVRPTGNTRGTVTFSTATRTLPNKNSISAITGVVAPRYNAQLEAVLAKDEIPLHRKDVVRRYFLGLSTQVDAPSRVIPVQQEVSDDR